jgi:hypothetical protein
MASIADQLIQGTQQSIRETDPFSALSGGIKQGVQLASQMEQMQANRQKLEASKEALFNKSEDSFLSLIKTIPQAPKEARGLLLKIAKAKRDTLPGALKGVYSDDALDFAFKGDENARRVVALENMFVAGDITKQELRDIINDQPSFLKIIPAAEGVESRLAQATKLQESEKDRQAKIEAAKAKAETGKEKFDIRRKERFFQQKRKEIAQSQQISTKFKSTVSFINDADKILKLAIKENNAPAFVQGIKSMIKITDPKISDADFALVAKQLGINKLAEEAGKAVGQIQKKTASDALDILRILKASKAKIGRGIQARLSAKAKGLSDQFAGEFESKEQIEKALGLGDFFIPTDEKGSKKPKRKISAKVTEASFNSLSSGGKKKFLEQVGLTQKELFEFLKRRGK